MLSSIILLVIRVEWVSGLQKVYTKAWVAKWYNMIGKDKYLK